MPGGGGGCRKGTGFAVSRFSFLCPLGWVAVDGPALTPFLAASPCPDAPRNLTISVFRGSPTGKQGCPLPRDGIGAQGQTPEGHRGGRRPARADTLF